MVKEIITIIDYPRPGNPSINKITQVPVINTTPEELLKKLALAKYDVLAVAHQTTELRLSNTNAVITIHSQKRVVYSIERNEEIE